MSTQIQIRTHSLVKVQSLTLHGLFHHSQGYSITKKNNLREYHGAITDGEWAKKEVRGPEKHTLERLVEGESSPTKKTIYNIESHHAVGFLFYMIYNIFMAKGEFRDKKNKLKKKPKKAAGTK